MLHIINQSPFSSTALQDCLRCATQEDAVLLIEDGVYAALASSTVKWPAQTMIYALQEDCAARGLCANLDVKVQLIDYAGFVELSIIHPVIQSWGE